MKALLGLALAAACGPPGPSLAENAQARVWRADGAVWGCHAARPQPVRLGRRGRVHEVRVAGGYAGVHTRDLLVIHDLRRGRIEQTRQVRGTLTRWRLGRGGIAVWLKRRDDGAIAVGSSLDGPFTSGPEIDPEVLGLAGTVFAFRDGATHHVHDLEARAHGTGTLFRAGDVRVVGDPTRYGGTLLYARSGRDRRLLGESKYGCDSANGCSGTEAIQIAGRFVASRFTEVNRDFGRGAITVRRVDGGRARRYCDGRGSVGGFVLTETGGLACGFWPDDGRYPPMTVPEIRVGRTVVASGRGIRVDSLRRRGDQLVWLEDGVERTAPLPT